MKKKLVKTLTGLTLLSGTLCPLLASCSKPEVIPEYHIMAISDIRGEIPGYGDISFPDTKEKHPGAIRTIDAMQAIAEKSKDYVVLSAGDQNSSGKFSACTQGETMYPVLKAMEVRYSAVGNHAWDWGDTKLEDPQGEKSYDKLGRTDKTEGNYFLASNILQAKVETSKKWVTNPDDPKFADDYALWYDNKVKWADPYKVVDLDGHKICLIGLTTRDTAVDSNQTYTNNKSFIDYNASVVYSKYLFKQEDEETYNKIESFILLTHCGALEEDKWISGEVCNLAQAIETPVDAIIAAHTQKEVCGYVFNNKFNRKVAIAEVPEKMQAFMDMKLTFDDTKPVGQRFVSIEPNVIYPHIANESFEAASIELKQIANFPRNQIVKNVFDEYEIQKSVAIEQLSKAIGNSQTETGLAYLQVDQLKKYLYPEDIKQTTYKNVLVEEAGAYTAKSLIGGFNTYFKEQSLDPTKYKKANISIVSNDSINRGIAKPETKSAITLSDLYNLFPYDEFTVTLSLTYFQLEQIIRYMFTGKLQHSVSDKCTDEFLFVEDTKPAKTYDNLAFPFGPTQFYGFAFNVKDADKSDKQFRKYDYDDDDGQGTLLVYDPDNNDCIFDDPTTWKGKDYWKDDKKYITLVMNSFNFDGGNKQFQMIQDFGLFNENETTEPIHIKKFYSLDVRDLAQLYIKSDTNVTMDIATLKLLAQKEGA